MYDEETLTNKQALKTHPFFNIPYNKKILNIHTKKRHHHHRWDEIIYIKYMKYKIKCLPKIRPAEHAKYLP